MSREVDDKLAAYLARPGAKYVLLCRDCRSGWSYKQDSKTVKAARDGRADCPDCGSTLDLAVDDKADTSGVSA